MKSNSILSRKRVMEALQQITKYPITILSATMGYGKTTAMRDYLNCSGVQSIWLSLNGCGGDEAVFWKSLCKAIEKGFPEVGRRLDRIGFPIDARQRAAITEVLWELDNGHETVFVMDDYHMIDQSISVGAWLEQLVEEEIQNLHIVLLTRTRPKFNQMNMVAKGLCNYLGTDLLAFTMQEIQDYFSFMDFPILPQEAKQIYLYSEGWISAVYLLLLGMQKGSPMTEVSNITQLVNENLFSTLEESVQQVLIRLSVLDEFTLAQAEDITENNHVPRIMKRLMEQNAFVEFDPQTGIYELHNVLLDFLRDKVETEKIDLRPFCQRAGSWFLEQGETISAFAYYHRAKRLEELLNRINQMEFVGCWYIGIDLLWRIYPEIPMDCYTQYPFPMLHFARSFILSGDRSAIAESVKIVTTLGRHYAQPCEISEKQRHRILGEIEVIKIFLSFNDAEKMVMLSRNAKMLLGEEASVVVLRDNEFSFGMPHFLYTYYRQPGTLRETVDWIQAGFPPEVFGGCGTGCELVALAEYALETGDWVNAAFFANKAIYKAKTMQQTGVVLCADFTMLRLCLLEGKFADAKAHISHMRSFLLDLREEINSQNAVIYNNTVDLCEGFLYGCLNAPDLMPEWLRTGDFSSRVLMLHGLGFPSLIHEKAVLLTKNWIELEVLCEHFAENKMPYHNQLGLIYNSIYAAIAKRYLYHIEAGAAALLPALLAAQTDGILLPFAENAAFLLPMLYSMVSCNELEASYIDRLIPICEQYEKNLQREQAPPAQLTLRENEVLQLLAQGMTQREMADRLCLSVSGVKKHLERIYGKFGVNNKVRAVQKAQEVGLL